MNVYIYQVRVKTLANAGSVNVGSQLNLVQNLDVSTKVNKVTPPPIGFIESNTYRARSGDTNMSRRDITF